MQELAAYQNGLLSALEGVSPELSRLVEAIPSHIWQFSKKPGAHTPHYTLARMCGLDVYTFGSPLRSIVDKDIPLLPLFDEIAWMSGHYAPGKPAQVFLEEYIQLRKQEVHWLRSLSPECWSRTARHPWWGVRTLQWWVELQLEYSLQHLAEITSFLTM
jgi:hypothetical protein